MSDHADLTKCGPECILELQEAVTEAEMRANALESQNQALREALEHINEHIKHYPNQPLDKGCRERVRTALSPTQETDPG